MRDRRKVPNLTIDRNVDASTQMDQSDEWLKRTQAAGAIWPTHTKEPWMKSYTTGMISAERAASG